MTELSYRSTEGSLVGRIMQIDVKLIWQFQFDLSQWIAWTRILADLVGKSACPDGPPVDAQPLGVTWRTVQQNHVMACQPGVIALELRQYFLCRDRPRHSPWRVYRNAGAFCAQDRGWAGGPPDDDPRGHHELPAQPQFQLTGSGIDHDAIRLQ